MADEKKVTRPIGAEKRFMQKPKPPETIKDTPKQPRVVKEKPEPPGVENKKPGKPGSGKQKPERPTAIKDTPEYVAIPWKPDSPQTNSKKPEKQDTSKKKTVQSIKDHVSVNNAKKMFTNFSLGKTDQQKSGRYYVEKGQSVLKKQREVMINQLKSQEEVQPSNPGLTIIVSNTDDLKLSKKTMELSTLIQAMEKAKTGHAFYTKGSTIKDQLIIQNRAEELIKAIKKGGTKNG